ncbi:MAG: hypothetical protein ACI81R_002842 [Bradymonadia bacterium]|jgi:uncharacterized protein (TIGR00266 family)
MSDAWYVGINGQQEGPLPFAQVAERLQAGTITAQAYVYGPGCGDWTAINTVPAFAAYFGGAAPPAPAPAGVPVPAGGKFNSAAEVAHEIDFQLYGEDMQFVEITLDPGEACVAEAGAMMFMDTNIEMETIFGDGSQGSAQGGVAGMLLSAGKRMITGESLFMTVFGNQDPSYQRKVAFGAPYPGTIVPIDLREHAGKIICQKDAFLCAAKGISVGVELQKKLGVGFFGGEGFIMQKLEGQGLAFLHAGGVLVSRDLQAGETLRLDTGCLVGMEASVQYDIKMAKGIKSAVFGGEGLFLATLTGPGKIWIQSLPFSRLASRVYAAAPQTGGHSVGEGSVLGGLGKALMGDN